MSILSSRSGLVQTVKPNQRIESYQHLRAGEQQVDFIQQAGADPDAPVNVAPYDGDSAFGLFAVDETLAGVGQTVAVPNIVGLTAAAANSAITGAGLVVGEVTGTVDPVATQSPTAGVEVALGASIDYTLTS